MKRLIVSLLISSFLQNPIGVNAEEYKVDTEAISIVFDLPEKA